MLTALLPLQPTVCERELCVFAFQTLGVMNEAADEIATGAQVRPGPAHPWRGCETLVLAHQLPARCPAGHVTDGRR